MTLDEAVEQLTNLLAVHDLLVDLELWEQHSDDLWHAQFTLGPDEDGNHPMFQGEGATPAEAVMDAIAEWEA